MTARAVIAMLCRALLILQKVREAVVRELGAELWTAAAAAFFGVIALNFVFRGWAPRLARFLSFALALAVWSAALLFKEFTGVGLDDVARHYVALGACSGLGLCKSEHDQDELSSAPAARKGNLERKIAEYNAVIRRDPTSAEAFFGRGTEYLNNGDFDSAIADLDEAIRLNPKFALAFSNRGLAYGYKGDTTHAISDLDATIRLNPKSARAFLNRGIVFENSGDHIRAIAELDEAIRLFDEIIRVNPKSAQDFANRGLAYEIKGDRAHAIADYNAAKAVDSNFFAK